MLRFLKAYYRHRPRSGETELSSDMRGAGGIIADGFLSFPREDGERFTATFEATSYDTRDEVRFDIKKELLHWDSLMAALFFTSLLYGISYLENFLTIRRIGATLNASLVIFCTIAFFLFFKLFLRYMRRYRFIYAIEQFKRYHADEQWVAVGEDVFSGPSDPYYLELRKQCIYNGFGLILVDGRLRGHLQITPTRKEIFSEQRREISFISLEELNKKVSQGIGADWLRRFGQGRNRWLFAAGEFLPVGKRYFHQIAVSSFALLLIAGLFYKEIQDKPVKFVNEKTYPREVVEKVAMGRPEPITYLLDTPYVRPFLKKVNPYLQVETFTASDDQSTNQDNRADALVFSEGDSIIYYDCSRFFTTNTKYIIQEEEYPDLELALLRIWEINESTGIQANSLRLRCFYKEIGRYAVFLGPLFESYNEANEELIRYQSILSKEMPEIRLKIRSLPPGNVD